VAVIGDEVKNYPRARDLAQKMFALPNVEPASHSQSHPIDWTGINIENEISGSIEYLNKTVTPKEKPVRLLTWSGMANPSAPMLRALKATGVPAINGINMAGGFVNRFDALYPSRTHLAPATRRVGTELQINHRAANDYALTNEWAKDDREKYKDILATFKHTRTNPEIPVHVYFHAYSAQNGASLAALTKVLSSSFGSA
jgi:peptidoglycan/xylan/chitin deacetylase (PgdA/CDA1 family)